MMSARPRRAISSRMAGVRHCRGTTPPYHRRADARSVRHRARSVIAPCDQRRGMSASAQSSVGLARAGSGCSRPCSASPRKPSARHEPTHASIGGRTNAPTGRAVGFADDDLEQRACARAAGRRAATRRRATAGRSTTNATSSSSSGGGLAPIAASRRRSSSRRSRRSDRGAPTTSARSIGTSSGPVSRRRRRRAPTCLVRYAVDDQLRRRAASAARCELGSTAARARRSPSPSSADRASPPSTAARTRRPVQSGSMIGSTIVVRRRLAERPAGAAAAPADRGAVSGARIMRRSQRSYPDVPRAIIRAVTSPADRPASRATRRGGLAALTPSGRAIVPIAWALYDFANTIFSFAVVSGAIGLWLVDDPVRRARRQRPAERRDRRQRRAQRPRLADPRRALATAAAAGCRSCCSSPRCASSRPPSSASSRADRRPRPVHRRELRLPGGAHLLRRHAQDGQLPGDARQAVRDRRRRSATAARSSSGC